MNKEMHVYKMEFYSARKKMKLLFVGKWMKREHHARKSLSHMQSLHLNIHTLMYVTETSFLRTLVTEIDICGNIKVIFLLWICNII